MSHEQALLTADAEDRRAALAAATAIAASRSETDLVGLGSRDFWLVHATRAYRWLRDRDTLRITSIEIIPGMAVPMTEGTASDMTTSFSFQDGNSVTFTLSGKDAAGYAVPLPAGYTASWTLADPDSTGATLTPSADTTSATLTAGAPDTNLMVSVTVTVTNPDGSTSTFQGAEAVIVTAGPVSTLEIVPGTPVATTPPAAGTSPSGGTTGTTSSPSGGTTTPAA